MTELGIKPLEAPYTADESKMLEKLMPPNAPQEPLKLFRVLVQNLDLSSRMRPLASGILGHGTIKASERELLILRTCARCDAEYEWGVHATAFGAEVGLSEEQIQATVCDNMSVWSERELALLQIADELHDAATVNDKTWHTMTKYWNTEQIIEILMIVGWYHSIAYVCNAARVPYEDWAAHFPDCD